MNKKRIGIKVGSALLAEKSIDGNYMINKQFCKTLMRQIANLISAGHEVFLVSSGAVASDYHPSRSKELRAAVGQHKLMAMYQTFLDNYVSPAREAAQFLLLKEDLTQYHDHIREVIVEAFDNDVLSIINAHDTNSSYELNRLDEFEDNDRLFEAVCRMMRPDYAIIATDVDGVMDDSGQVIHDSAIIRGMIEAIPFLEFKNGSRLGTGGMASKVAVATNLADAGIKTIIVNGRKSNFIELALGQLSDDPGSEQQFGTVFSPNYLH